MLIDQRLVTFLTVCKTNNFTRAAELLNLTQPAVTKHIKSLEDYYGTPLFTRKGRLISLTKEGEVLFNHAKVIEAQTSLLERKIKNSHEAVKRHTIGATLTIGEYILPDILGRYKAARPNTDIIMQVYNTEVITKKLLNGEIDLGLVEGPFNIGKFQYVTLKEDELVLAASPQSQLAGKSEVDLEEVLKSKLILREEGSGTRKVLENTLIDLGFNLNNLKPYMEIGSIGAIKSLVGLNLGCTIISRAAVQKEASAGTLLVIPIKGIRITREFNCIFLKDSPMEFVDDFVRFSKGTLA